MSTADQEDKVMQLITSSGPAGVAHSALKAQLSMFYDLRTISDILRSLLSAQKIELTKNAQGEPIVMRRQQVPERLAVVLEAIKLSGAQGADATMIASKTKMVKTEVTKALASLMQQGLVRETRSLTNRARKLFVLAEFEQSVEVTGGVFYNEQREVDVYFIDTVRNAIVEFVSQRNMVSAVEVKQHLDTLGLPKILAIGDVERAVGTLVLDDIFSEVPRLGDATGGVMYKMSPASEAAKQRSRGVIEAAPETMWSRAKQTVLQIPCVGCPQYAQCQSGDKGSINAWSCTYLSEWLTVPNSHMGNSTTSAPDTLEIE